MVYAFVDAILNNILMVKIYITHDAVQKHSTNQTVAVSKSQGIFCKFFFFTWTYLTESYVGEHGQNRGSQGKD